MLIHLMATLQAMYNLGLKACEHYQSDNFLSSDAVFFKISFESGTNFPEKWV